MASLNGPQFGPASGGEPKNIVVFLHGLCADGNDLISLGAQWAKQLPDTLFISPNAPEPCASMPFGRYQWFPISFTNDDDYWNGVQKAGPLLETYLMGLLAKHKLNLSQLALVGFSQGCMMALHTGLRLKEAPAAILGYSGRLAGPEHLKKQIKCRPPVQLVHGSLDQVVPPDSLQKAETELKGLQVPVQSLMEKNVPHGIGPKGFALGGQFLAKHLK